MDTAKLVVKREGFVGHYMDIFYKRFPDVVALRKEFGGVGWLFSGVFNDDAPEVIHQGMGAIINRRMVSWPKNKQRPNSSVGIISPGSYSLSGPEGYQGGRQLFVLEGELDASTSPSSRSARLVPYSSIVIPAEKSLEISNFTEAPVFCVCFYTPKSN